MEISRYISDKCRIIIRDAIKEAEGNEVFFTGSIDENGLVTEVKIGARGNEHTVTVNFSDSQNLTKASVLIHNHPGGNLTPSQADLNVAANASENAQGFYIVNNSVTEIYVVVEPVKPHKITKLDEEEAGGYISNGGSLSKISKNFEERKVQIELLKKIANAFNNNSLGVFEAGTGVGKSFAYLIPSVLWAVKNKERVVVSTGTINLQQQLCEKDLPAVEKILNIPFRYILMKGRQNYICKRRLADAGAVRDLFDTDIEELDKIIDWEKSSATGSRSDLAFMPSDSVWSRVNSESDACMGMRCPFHADCFVMKVRKAAADANIIVVNHHLLFADIESRIEGAGYDDTAVLPPYKHIIFDEAHGIESAATSFFSESFTRFKINKLINQMYRKRKNAESGHLFTLALLSSNEEKAEKAGDIVQKIKNDILNLEIACMDLLGNESTKRLYAATARDFGPVLVTIGELSSSLGSFTDLIHQIMEGIDDDDKDTPSWFESKTVVRRLEAYVLLLKSFCAWDEKKDSVYWIQKKRLPPAMATENTSPDYITLTSTPLEIARMMNEGVFEPMQSVIFTSATLRTGRDFYYWMNRTGITFAEKERIRIGDFPSPFPYEKNMLFAVPSDAPMADSMEYQQYIEMALPRLIKAAEGRTLVLFTARESLNSAHRACQSYMKGFKGRLMKQGEDDPGRLLQAFKEEKESVLFATDSFWQGVDVPGDSLMQVIIVKLPFSVPNDPVFTARSDAIKARGGNSFMELSVPEAVIKFRQGIGRLIRRSDDKGVVTVLDRRIYEKRYGSIFTASIPQCKRAYEPLSELTKRINGFIFD